MLYCTAVHTTIQFSIFYYCALLYLVKLFLTVEFCIRMVFADI